jgi:hypothetical protein
MSVYGEEWVMTRCEIGVGAFLEVGEFFEECGFFQSFPYGKREMEELRWP